MNVLLSKDFLAGILYIAFGLLGLWLGRALETGSADAMGPGYFPRIVCALLIAIGALLLAVMTQLKGGGVAKEVSNAMIAAIRQVIGQHSA